MKFCWIHLVFIAFNFLFCYSLDSTTIVMAIDSGLASGTYTASNGATYSADMYSTSGTNHPQTHTVANTNDDSVYSSERYDSVTWGYNLPISTDGTYTLILQFCEVYFTTTNSRKFTVKIGNYVVANNLDIVAQTGAAWTAYDIFTTFILSSGTVTIAGNAITGAYTSGKLVVTFNVVTQNPQCSGLILVKGDCSVADNCNMCYQQKCQTCNLPALTCATCIANATPVSGVCQCNAGTLWVVTATSRACVICDNLCSVCNSADFLCGTCAGANVLVTSVCLRACPYGFGASCASVSTAVIDQNFADYFYGAYGLFRTGTSSASYYHFVSPESVDPIPAKSRGLYFSGGRYLQTTSNIYISLNFSFGMWVWILSGSGDILTNSPGNKITISANGAVTIILESKTETTTTVTTTALSPSNTAWAYISFIVSFTSGTISTTIVPYLNNSPQASATSTNYIYRDATSNTIILGKSASTNFSGYIYQFTLWNVAVSNFNTQYSNQICGTGLVATCLWTCPLSQWMNGATPTNCNSCTNGCVRSVSCNVCYDPLCSICSGFLTGLCSQCVSNASGTPCACNTGYTLSTDGFSCVPCSTGCASCTGASYYQCSSCLSSYYLLKTLCLTYCPTGYTADSTAHSCTLSASNSLSVALQNLIQLDTVSGVSVGSSNTNKYPSWESADPIPSIYRGYYFSGSNYMSLASFTISPYFSLLIWVKPLNNGYLFMKYDGTTKYCYITFASGIPSMNIILADASSLSISGSSSILSGWHYLAFTSDISSGNTVFSLSIDGVSLPSVTSGPSSYFKDLGSLYVAKDTTASGGFTGFLWSLNIYNDNTYASQEWKTSGCPTACTAACPSELKCPDSCPLGQFYSTSCVSCVGSCPYGCRSTQTCRLCKDKECAACTLFDGPCTSCITNASPSGTTCVCNNNAFWEQSSDGCQICDNLCSQCQTTNYFLCTSCGTYTLVSNVCLRSCPYGFTSPCVTVTSAVIDVSFNADFQGTYSIFTTGTSSSSYQFFNSPETVDPIPAKQRGLYFNGSQYLMSNTNIYLSHSFAMGLWIYVISAGDILTNSRIIVASSGSINIPLESPYEVTSSQTLSSASFSNWKFLSFASSFNNPAVTTTLTVYNNNAAVATATYNTVIYRDQANQKIKLGGSASSYFTGFINNYKLWNVAIFDFSTQLNEICGSGLLATCLWSCNINNYWNSAACTSCDAGCNSGCTRTGSCNVCDDPLCSVCSGFGTNKCTSCVTNAAGTPCTCNVGYMVSSSGFSCVPCYTGCGSCTGTLYYQCSSCVSSYYLLKTLCLTYCPTGYTADSTAHSCTLSTSNPLSVALQNLIQLDTVSGVSVGSSNTNKYPSWESTDPIPSIYRGYYFSGSNYMSLASFIISPYFSLLIWVKPLNDGYLFMKFDGTTKYCYITFASGIPSVNLILADSSSLSKSGTSNILSGWHYLSFICGLSSGNTVITLSIDGVSLSSVTSGPSSYFKDLGSLYIAKDTTASGGFTGFLWSLNIYNDNTYASQEWKTSGCPTACTAACPSELKCPDSCPLGQFYSTSCVSCVGSCPYGCRSTLTCRLCKDKECAACTLFDGPCTSCITNASPSGTTCVCNNNAFWEQSSDGCQICDNLCSQCQTTNYFLCTSCGAYTLVSNVCLRSCPYGFTSPCVTVTSAVIDVSFNADFQGTYSIFTTGTSSSSYQFFNSPETVDPIPAKQRGLYFNGSQYLISNTNIYLSHSFAMGLWIYVISPGDIITNSRIVVSSSGSINIPLESPSEVTSSQTLSSASFSNWKFLSFTSSFNNPAVTTTLTVYNNNAAVASSTYNTIIYRDQTNQKIKLGGSSATYFTGFIYNYKLWNVAIFDFSAQLDEICGSGLLATCLWTCDINKYWNSAVYINCDSGCNSGCTRTGSCNICDDPLCSTCSGFGSGKCTNCVTNAAGTPCACNVGYMVSSDGFSCVLCSTGCNTCTGVAYYQCNSCLSSYYLLNTMCLSYCPTGYTADSTAHSCTLSTANSLSVALQNLIQLDTISGLSVGSSNTNKYPSWETTDPIPSIYRGYYFSGSNYMSLASFTISPYFSLLIWVKPLNDGYLFMKYDGTTKYCYINFASGIPSINLKLADSSSLSISGTSSILSGWHYLAFTGGLSSGNTVITLSIDGVSVPSVTSGPSSYYKDLGSLYIAKDTTASGGFTGFLWSLNIYNDNTYAPQEWKTSGCPSACTAACPSELKCPDSCPLGQFYSTSCVSCTGSCPYGCRSTLTCRLCKDKECASCTLFDGPCTSCITNASPSGTTCVCNNNAFWEQSSDGCQICDNLCSQCQTNDYFLCTSCGAYTLVSSVCIRSCPYGFTNPCVTVTSPVIDAKFNGDFQGTYSVFTTGTSSSSYQFFNTPETVDPIPAKQRGLYFNGSQYLISNANIYLSHSFAMGLWIYVIAPGDIISNSRINVDSSGSINIPLESPSEVTSSKTLTSTSFTFWKYLAFTSSFNNPAVTTTLTVYNNNNQIVSSTYNTLIYRDQANNKIKIGGSSSSYFTGFIYSYQLWNVAIFDFTTQIDEICGSGLLATCLWACDINNYLDSTVCKNCDSGCTLGCTRTGSCNICDDPLCSVCSGFDANKCSICVSNAHGAPCSCDPDYYLAPSGFSCLPCYNGCSSCSSSHYYQCSACDSSYYLLNVICDTQCPSGYTQNSGTNKCDLTNSLAVDLEFNDYIVLDTLSGFTVGINTANIYPIIDANDPIPAINRGYYFTGQSYMSGFTIFSPYFSVMLWVKTIDQGVLLEKYNGASKYLTIKVDSNGFENLNLLLKDGSSLNAIGSQNVLSDWHYLSFSGKINGDGTYSSNIYFDTTLLITSTSTSTTYLRDSTSGSLLIGFDQTSSTGFKGFLWNLKIYNDETHANSAWTTTTCNTNPCTSCPSGNFCPSSCPLANYPSTTTCASCKSSSCTYGCRNNLACNLCREKECYQCRSFSNDCINCITNAGFVGNACQCNTNAYWNGNTETCDLCNTICTSCSGPTFTECIQCASSLFMLSNICLNFCPSGFTTSGNSCNLSNELAFSLRLSQIKDNVYDAVGNVAFQTGNDNKFYPFYTPEDPFAAVLRGYYFRGTSFMKSIGNPPSLTFGAVFTISAWINPTLDTGYIFSKQDNTLSNYITLSLSSGKLSFSMKLKGIATPVSFTSSTLSITLGSWNFIAVKSIISSTPQQQISFYVGTSNEISTDLGSSWYQDISSSFFISIGAGPDLSTNLYKGFLWSINICNVDEPITNIIISGTCSGCSECPIELSKTCIPNCDLPYYPNALTCSPCQAQCSWGCVRNDKNCNLCQDVICLVCDDYTSICITCRDHAHLSVSACVCDDGYYWDLTKEECSLCDSTCKSCKSSASSDCIVCASGLYMYLGWCISQCPDGYIAKGSVCVEKDPFIFYLSFDTLEGVVIDKQSSIPALTGNSTAFYPDYDEFDPLAASLRGFYFNGVSSIMHLPIYPNYTSPILSFGYSFTFSIWINTETDFGTIITKQDKLNQSIFSIALSSGIVAISLNFKTGGLAYFYFMQNIGSFQWNHIAFTAEYSASKQTKMSFYLNGVVDNQRDMGYDYFNDKTTDLTFTLGASKDSLGYSNYFKGFIYDIKGYSSVKSISSLALPTAQCLENCNACLTNGTCIPNCLISQYWIGPQYNKCSKCNSQCLSCRDSSKFCNLCDNPKCTSCLDFSSDSCLNCTSGTSNITNCQCDYGLAWNSSSGICEMCHQWQYKANDTCIDCPSLCAQCENENKCLWCITNAVLNFDKCTCAPGYIGNTSCVYVSFNATLTVNLNNTLILSFSDSLVTNLTTYQIYIKISNQTIESFTITYLSNSSYLIACDFGGGVKKGTIVKVYFINPDDIESISGGVIHDEYLSGSLYKSLQTAEEQQIAQIQNQVSAGVKVLVGSGVALAMFNPSPSGFWTMLNTIQLLAYIPYANYPLTDKIVAFFEAMNGFNFVPNVFSLFMDQSQGNTPYHQAKKYGYDSDLILINIGNDATILCALIAMIPLTSYLSKCSERFIGKKFKKIYNDYKFGVFLRFWILIYLESGFAAIVGILSANSSDIYPGAAKFSNLLICWAFLTMILMTPLLLVYSSYKNAKNIINKRNKQWLVPWNSLYYEFKNDIGFMSTQYYTLFFIRRLIFIAVQVLLNDYPQSQLTINTVSALCIALYIFVYKPFEDPIIQYTNLITECGISITFMMICPYFFDLTSVSLDTMDSCIMIFVISIMAAQTTGPLINCIKQLYELAKRSMNNEVRSHPIKRFKNPKRIDMNNLSNFFDETQANIELGDAENMNLSQDNTSQTKK